MALISQKDTCRLSKPMFSDSENLRASEQTGSLCVLLQMLGVQRVIWRPGERTASQMELNICSTKEAQVRHWEIKAASLLI